MSQALVSGQVSGVERIIRLGTTVVFMARGSPKQAGVARVPDVSRDHFHSLLKPLFLGLASVLLALAFMHLGSEVMEGDTRGFDNRLLHLAGSLRIDRAWLVGVLEDLSALGSTTALTLFTIITVGYLAMVSSRLTALLVGASTISAIALVEVFKSAFGRARPDAALAELVVPGLSFPSGHASMSAVVFLTIGALVASTRSRVPERTYVLACAALMTLLIGGSRVALGVHWATDVLGGWAFGAAWASAWLLVARWLTKQ